MARDFDQLTGFKFLLHRLSGGTPFTPCANMYRVCAFSIKTVSNIPIAQLSKLEDVPSAQQRRETSPYYFSKSIAEASALKFDVYNALLAFTQSWMKLLILDFSAILPEMDYSGEKIGGMQLSELTEGKAASQEVVLLPNQGGEWEVDSMSRRDEPETGAKLNRKLFRQLSF